MVHAKRIDPKSAIYTAVRNPAKEKRDGAAPQTVDVSIPMLNHCFSYFAIAIAKCVSALRDVERKLVIPAGLA
jgi:hypothetical protein